MPGLSLLDGLSTVKHDSFVAKTFPGVLKETISQLKKSQPALFFKPATSAIDEKNPTTLSCP